MGISEITQVLKRETEAWNAHDADGVAACYAVDAKLSDVGQPGLCGGARQSATQWRAILPPSRIFTS